MIPAQILEMLKTPGIYMVSADVSESAFSVVVVDRHGQCVSMTRDNVLHIDGWAPGVVVRGPLSFDSPTLGDTPS